MGTANMKENFEKSIDFVLKWEGGETYDTGGHTKFGISKNAHPDIDIVNLTLEQAKDIYKKEYWDKCECDEMSFPEDIVIFDSAVNLGTNKVMSWFEEIQHDYRNYLLLRIQHYTTLAQSPKYQPYFRGWMNRVMELYRVVSED